MPLQATSGAASYDAFGGGVAAVPNYIEDVFSTYLYTGNGTSQTITNGIDLSTKGGLTWIKERSGDDSGNAYHCLFDTARGVGKALYSNTTLAQSATGTALTAFNTTGFSVATDTSTGRTNDNNDNYVSWTFRKQPKFFDVVTYTGNGTAGRTVAHSLGSVPACIIVKNLSQAEDWDVYHTSLGNTQAISLNTTGAAYTSSTRWNNTSPTSTVFTVGGAGTVNRNGDSYVAYLFAHDAGGFGLTGSDNVISCGSYTGNGSASGPAVNLGYEPQWVMIKNATDATNWAMFDNMRGIATGGTEQRLYANTSGAEVTTSGNDIDLTATGFDIKTDLGYLNTSGSTFIYIAIRRGPMKVPTSGTSVFTPVLANGGDTTITTNFPVDLLINKPPSSTNAPYFMDRLRGGTTNTYNILQSSSTSAELVGSGLGLGFQSNVGIQSSSSFYGSGTSVLWLNFRRAPSFFDEVCYTGTGSAGRAITHNLGVAPELVIVKNRSVAGDNWEVLCAFGTVQRLRLNLTTAGNTSVEALFGDGSSYIAPTASTFTVANLSSVNGSGSNLVAYLFATCAGVSKVGSYTGNGSSQTINCGFTGGARFVMVKATSTTGNWIVADSARGIVAGNDPALYLNSTAAEVTGLDWIDADNSGFVVNETATIAANTNGVTYIFLAIA